MRYAMLILFVELSDYAWTPKTNLPSNPASGPIGIHTHGAVLIIKLIVLITCRPWCLAQIPFAGNYSWSHYFPTDCCAQLTLLLSLQHSFWSICKNRSAKAVQWSRSRKCSACPELPAKHHNNCGVSLEALWSLMHFWPVIFNAFLARR